MYVLYTDVWTSAHEVLHKNMTTVEETCLFASDFTAIPASG